MSGISRAQESASADTAADGSDLNDRNGSISDVRARSGRVREETESKTAGGGLAGAGALNRPLMGRASGGDRRAT